MSKERYQAVAQILRATKAQIAVILAAPEDELHKLKMEQNLQRDIDYILLVTGAGDLQEGSATVLGPAKTIGGKPIGRVRKFTEADLIPEDDKVYNLKLQVEAALDYFGPDSNSAGILANIPELVIRGVAKKAGLKVTKDEPKELTVEFIDQIKQALNPMKLEVPELTEEQKQALSDAFANGNNPAPVINPDPTPETNQLPAAESEASAPASAPASETESKAAETNAGGDASQGKAADTNQPKPEPKKTKPGK